MKPSTVAPLSLLLVGALAAPASASLKPVEQSRALTDFTKVDVSGAFDVRINRGERYAVVVEARPDDLEHVQTTKRGDTLKIGWEGWGNVVHGKIRVQVTLPKLEGIDASGATELVAEDVRAERLVVDASGASDIALSGEVGALDLDLSGATKLDAAELRAKAVRIDASGASKVKVHATASLSVEASGASRIRYKGTPKTVNSDVSGAGSLSRL